DVDHKTVLYYARYRCTGPHATRTFSTIDDEYLASSPELSLAFPYLLTYQTGVSRELFHLVYDSVLTTRGISGASSSVTRSEAKNANYSPPMLVSLEQYMEANACLDDEALQKIWLTQTEICSRLLEAHMTQCKIKRVIRLDHSQKFCSKLKVFGAQGKKDQSSEVRMLLLAQNEIGQIVARGLTYSKNHAETAAILKPVFNGALVVKQDPFHVIQRFTEKVKDHVMRGWLATELSSAIYTADHKIREPEEMATLFSTALGKIPASSLNVKEPEWQGCIASNLNQIRVGDLFVGEAEYVENGGRVRVLSTSQLEAVHSKLCKLLDRIVSYETGLRILDIFLLQVTACRSYSTICVSNAVVSSTI
ncbi:hypothetical protein PHYSODRAFT_496061, partial [Phytophthora sojae]